jgi:predicted flap endonuclease-1-like 5' DNA nuclease/predicted  nucleic acid-binding Zn-ribbon protein
MESLSPPVALIFTVVGLLGVLLGWAIGAWQAKARIGALRDDWQIKLDNFVRERDRLTSETAHLRKTVEQQQGAIHRAEITLSKTRTELESLRERNKQLNKDIFTLRSEREDFKGRVSEIQNQMALMKRHAAELQSEFLKSREFYKGELTKAFERRKDLEDKLEQNRAEQASFANLLESSQSEQESINRMLASAQKRLGQMDILEQDVIRLEAEKAQLNHDYSLAKQEVETLQRDVAELDELKVQNRELAEVLKSMENSRKQYEVDAKRYRETAEQAEQKSETLRLRLDDVEKNFQEFERQQREALKDARKSGVPKAVNGKKKKMQKDDLQEIVGIGKVFEHALNELGVYTFQQIANFGISDIARVNAALKGSEGRMEADDWIGQARELHFKKYGDSEVA